MAVIVFLLLLLPAVFAQQNQTQNKQSDPQFVDFSGFKGKIFEIKNRDPRDLAKVLAPLGSGFKGAFIQPNYESKTLGVRDFPENLAAIEEAIKRLDTPLPPAPSRPITPNIEVTAYVLLASNDRISGVETPSLPPQLKDVVTQLQTTLNYKSYLLMTPIVQRAKLDGGRISSGGTAMLPDKSLSANYSFQVLRLLSEKDGGLVIVLDGLFFSFKGATPADQTQIGSAEIQTRLNVRDGEKVVVGTASLKDRALILVLTAKVLK
ncbi:MAG: secretin N-terminal domain-containing protein [Blastocatellales bacterium]